MDLINADHGDAAPILAQILREEPLWCDEEHFDLLVLDCTHDGLLDWEALLRIDASTWHEVWQLSKLVRHEGNQRSDHKDEPWHELRRVLVDEGLTASCGEDNERVLLLRDQDLDRIELTFKEVIVAESLLQDAFEAIVCVRNGKGSLIKIIDIDFYVFYMLINPLQLIAHLIDVVAKHLVVFVLAQLVSILPELLVTSCCCSCLLHLCPDKRLGLRTEGGHDILIGVFFRSVLSFGAIFRKQSVLCLLAHVVKADFA